MARTVSLTFAVVTRFLATDPLSTVADLGLETLRRQLSLIPQDPILFEGTIRTNLDPFEEHDDAALNRALQRARVLDQKRNTKLNLGALWFGIFFSILDLTLVQTLPSLKAEQTYPLANELC